jgi:hypothetical protein
MTDIREGRCPLCDHREIINAQPVEFCEAIPCPLAVTHLQSSEGGPSPLRPVGMFHVFVCRRCGYSQWFAERPEEIPIVDGLGTRLVAGPAAEGPYR